MKVSCATRFIGTYAWIEPTLIMAPPFGICGTACRTRSNTEEQSIRKMSFVFVQALTGDDIRLEGVFHSFVIQFRDIRLKIDEVERIWPDTDMHLPLVCLEMRHCWLGYRSVWISILQYRSLFYIELPEHQVRDIHCIVVLLTSLMSPG